LFGGSQHKVKKFVLHTNFPGHYNFNQYNRCYFHIPMMTSKCLQGLPPSSTPQGGSSRPREGRKREEEPEVVDITFDTKWDQIQDRLLEPGTKPVVLNRTSATNTTNPFGSNFCYGVQDVIFEVSPNQQIASVTLYQSAKRSSRPNSATISSA